MAQDWHQGTPLLSEFMKHTSKKITGRLPDVYIVGAQKAGTTSLFDWIAQHPRVFGNPAAKDVPFFAMDDVYAKGLQHLADFSRAAPADSLILGGEVSAMFLPTALARLHDAIPNAKLIVAIRNPVDRAYSAWQFAVERGLEIRSFEQAMADEIQGVPYNDNLTNMAYKNYLARGKYAEQLQIIMQYFPRKQIHVVIFEELRIDPARVFNEICQYLGVAEFHPAFEAKNVTMGGARFKWLQHLLYVPRSKSDGLAQFVRAVLPYKARFIVREFLGRINRVPSKNKSAMTREMRLQLVQHYEHDMQKLIGDLQIADREVLAKLGWGK